MQSSQTLTQILEDQRAWRASSVDDSASWVCTLSAECLTALDEFIQNLRNEPRPITQIRIQTAQLDPCRQCLQSMLTALDQGHGFALVERLPLERYAIEETRAMYWALGQLLGLPFEQDIAGTLLYEVRDTGQDVNQGARFSVTNAESTFHMDNSFGPTIPDFVGLLCLNPARSGGQSQLISAYALHNELLQHHPAVLDCLYRDFYFDRRGQFSKGEPPALRAPIFHWDGLGLTIRYLHYYIQVGHQQAGQPLEAHQKKALEVVEALLHLPDFRVEFNLRPGQMLFTNNRWILHNRTAFEDHSDAQRRRHYVRLWLRRQE